MSSLENAINLHKFLSARKNGAQICEILENLECSKATFFRVKEYAELYFGVRIQYEKKYGKYKLIQPEDAYELPGIWFTQEEIEAFVIIEHTIQGLQRGFLKELFTPVRKKFSPALRIQSIPVKSLESKFKIIPSCSRPVDDLVFKKIFRAILSKRKAEITYSPLSENKTDLRVISPQTLLRYRENWYVDAFCHRRNDLRCFALSRIENVTIAKEKAENVPVEKLKEQFSLGYGIFSGAVVNVAHIRFTGVAAREVSKEIWHSRQTGQWNDDGSYDLHIPYSNDKELIMDILRWGKEAKVLGPEQLKEKVKKCLRETLENY
ncbi:putative DeoR family regulatory protein [Chitinispirillum alkaliphilum]|nr:putative DeoR family regulatory protein [Chitinispirillum alkaliphilum]